MAKSYSSDAHRLVEVPFFLCWRATDVILEKTIGAGVRKAVRHPAVSCHRANRL
jgi:hypothetical protein